MPTDPAGLSHGDGAAEHRYELRGAGELDSTERAALARFAITELRGTRPIDAAAADRSARALELLGQGVGIVEPNGEIVWMSQGLSRQSPETLRRFADCCVNSISAWRRSRAAAATQRSTFRVGGGWYEVVMTPLCAEPGAAPASLASPTGSSPDPTTDRSSAGAADSVIEGTIALLVDASATRRLQDRLDAIDEAGVGLLRFDPELVRSMNAPERLALLEGRVVAATRSVLGFDHFEFRLTNRRTGQLELVFCSGLVPLGIGERIFARREGNGICGVVATTGESVVCSETESDPRYIPGLPGAHSSLTVPLRLHDHVVGVLNAESLAPGHFDDEDRICAELLGRYVSLSLNILDMLVTERCETSRAVVGHILDQTADSLEAVRRDAEMLRARMSDPESQAQASRLLQAVGRIGEILKSATEGPTGVLGADSFLREGARDPVFSDREILVADDDASIRRTVRAVLEQQGSVVSEAADGTTAIRLVRDRAAGSRPFDLVISDVRMPDANGYEVFCATKEACAATPIMLMTAFGYDPNHSIVRSSQAGLHCFLFKPFQVSQLLDEARKALTERPASGA